MMLEDGDFFRRMRLAATSAQSALPEDDAPELVPDAISASPSASSAPAAPAATKVLATDAAVASVL